MTFTRTALLASAALLPAVAVPAASAQDLPTGGRVVAGDATIGASVSGTMTITQTSERAVIDWTGFDIAQGHGVVFDQPGVHAMVLNRVTGSTGSEIAGTLRANGSVFIVNPNGIRLSPTGQVYAARGFVASTLDLANEAFMSGGGMLSGAGDGAIVNHGRITVGEHGYVGLLGNRVFSDGTIVAPLGSITIGAASVATLDIHGHGFLQLGVPAAPAAGGTYVAVGMAEAQDLARNVVNLPGEATMVGGSDGNIVLMGQVEARGGTVTVTGGGAITLNAVSIDVSGMEASGARDGGAVRIGGDWHGEGSMLRAANLLVDGQSVIRADAAGAGDGGSVVLWSDGHTDLAGTISARGGGVGGDGGMAEVSGRHMLAYSGAADLRAVAGRTGDLLLDPYNITISNGPSTGPGNDSVINASTLENQLETASVTISTRGGGTQAGDITVAVPLAWDANTLTLLAAGSVNVDAVMTAGGTAKLAVLTANGALNVRGGRVDFTGTGNGLSINGDAYTIITALGEAGSATGTDLQGIEGRPDGFYALGADIDASATAGWNAGAGFEPIGGGAAEFTGKFDGLGHVISGLTIQRPDQSNVGLFGTAARAAIGNVGLINAQVAGNEQVGTLVGRFFNSNLRNAHASGSVSGNFFVGGLVGFAFSDSTIRAAWSDVATSGGEAAGGIAGGAINAFVSEVLSTGSTSGSAQLGGIAGLVDSSTIADAHASGPVSGTSRLGGLVGGAYNATIINSYASGRVQGQSDTGGLVGVDASRLIASSYWNTETSGIAASASQGGVGKSTAELQKAATFADWSLDNVGGQDAVWRIYDGYTAPLLKVFLTPAVVDVTGQGSAVYDGTAQLAGVSYALRGGLSAGPLKGGLIGRTDAGTYAIGMDGIYSGQLGYDLMGGTVGSLTITPRPLSITADAITRIYGAGNPALTYAITEGSLVADDALRGALSTSARGDSDVGRYAIGAGTLTAGPNYAVLFRGGTLTITPRALTVTYTADMASRIYGDAGPALGGTVAVSGLLDGDALSGTAVWRTDATALSGVGHYGVTGSGLSAGGNYALNTVQAAGNATALTIAKRAITVVADDQFRVYGDANPQLGYSVTHGTMVNGDTLHGALATEANVRSDVGQYVIDAGALSAGENYDLTIGNGVLRIAPRPLTIMYGANAAERIYGDANPPLSGEVTVIGLANGDLLSGTADWTTDAGIRSDVGPYRVTGSGLDAGGNYSVTRLQADGNDRALTVNKRVLYVAADDGIRLEGEGIPPLGYTITAGNLVNGDVMTGALATDPMAARRAGDYAILPGTLTVSGNYDLQFSAGTLSVLARPATIPAREVASHGRIGQSPANDRDTLDFCNTLAPCASLAGAAGDADREQVDAGS